jgi:hypothetical protein
MKLSFSLFDRAPVDNKLPRLRISGFIPKNNTGILCKYMYYRTDPVLIANHHVMFSIHMSFINRFKNHSCTILFI